MSSKSQDSKTERPPSRGRTTAINIGVLAANVIFLAIAIIYFATRVPENRVKPIVEGSSKTQQRISQLELELRRDPASIAKAVELARLYQDVGEFPWSYDALRNAERSGAVDPAWRLKLGLAYLEIGKNDDGLRVLRAAQARCAQLGPNECRTDVAVKLDIFAQVAKILRDRRIDTRKHRAAADKALQEVLKPVIADPSKMRPKAPAAPASAPSDEPKH
jgi:hypothetical protein